MSNLTEKKFYEILELVPELSHIFPELEHVLKSDLEKTTKAKPAKKILEEIIDKYAIGKGGQGQMNFYPSEVYSPCMELCIGIATKGFGNKRDENNNRTGFKGLIKEIIEYWITCGSINKRTILFTTEWRDDDFVGNWKGIVDKYKAQGKEVIIIEVWNDNYIIRYK